MSAQPHPAWQRSLRLLVDSVVAVLAPADCRLCGDPLIRAADCPVCDPCLNALSGTPLQGGCRLCCEPLGFDTYSTADGIAGLCHQCVADPPKFAQAAAWGDYEHLRRAIHMMKFENVPGFGRPLGSLLAHAILSLKQDAPDNLYVVPVPLYHGKRQFNQSVLLAQSALRLVHKSNPDWSLTLRPSLLKRTRHTESQYLLSPAQRRENVRNAFAASTAVAGRHILLIDDVYTTGATAHECTRVLLRAGAISVRVATVARTVRDGAVRWQPPIASTTRDGPSLYPPPVQGTLPNPF